MVNELKLDVHTLALIEKYHLTVEDVEEAICLECQRWKVPLSASNSSKQKLLRQAP